MHQLKFFLFSTFHSSSLCSLWSLLPQDHQLLPHLTVGLRTLKVWKVSNRKKKHKIKFQDSQLQLPLHSMVLMAQLTAKLLLQLSSRLLNLMLTLITHTPTQSMMPWPETANHNQNQDKEMLSLANTPWSKLMEPDALLTTQLMMSTDSTLLSVKKELSLRQ